MKTHSEISRFLTQALGGEEILTPPPKGYIATLVDETTNAATSIRFQIPHTNPEMPGEPMVILTLIQRILPGEQVMNGELCASTLEYFLENKMAKESPVAKIPGNEIRYTVKDPKKKKGIQPLGWKHLPEHIHLHIARTVPWTVDDDPATVEKNIKEAREILELNIGKLSTVIEKTTQKRTELEKSLQCLP